MKTRLAVLALASLGSGQALADACDQIRHDQLKYSECMRNDPSRNRKSGPGYEKYYEGAPPAEEAPQENSYDRERRLKREAAEAERKAREDQLRDQEIIRQRKEGAREKQTRDAQREAALAKVRKIRAARVAAVDALAAKLSNPEGDVPETYDAILTAAAPEADLMVQWAKRAYTRFPKAFAFRHWLVMRSTCHAVKTEDKFSESFSPSAPCMPERAAAQAELPAAAQQGELPDRVLNCAYLHMLMGASDDTWSRGHLSKEVPADADAKVIWKNAVEAERPYVQSLAACEKDLGAAFPAVRQQLFKTMWTVGQTKRGDVLHSAVFGTVWRSRAVWGGRTTIDALQDPATVSRALATAESLVQRRLNGD